MPGAVPVTSTVVFTRALPVSDVPSVGSVMQVLTVYEPPAGPSATHAAAAARPGSAIAHALAATTVAASAFHIPTPDRAAMVRSSCSSESLRRVHRDVVDPDVERVGGVVADHDPSDRRGPERVRLAQGRDLGAVEPRLDDARRTVHLHVEPDVEPRVRRDG